MKLYAYLNEWSWECGDGCCSEDVCELIVSKDELREDVVATVNLFNWDGDDIIHLLKELGHEVIV